MHNDIILNLQAKELKITPQRVAIFEAIIILNNHPTADEVIAFIKKNHPNISVGTVYKVLNTLVEHDLIKKVKTEKDIMRYDANLSNHHHLYCFQTDRIEDFESEELTQLLQSYFAKNKIKNFEIKDIKLQITGKFKN